MADDFNFMSSAYSDPWAFSGPSLDTGGIDFMSSAYSDPYSFNQGYAPSYSFPEYSMPSQSFDFGGYDAPMVSNFVGGNFDPYNFAGYTPVDYDLPTSNSGAPVSFMDRLASGWDEMPFDKKVGMIAGGLSGLGSMMAGRQSNKLAKQMYERNKRLMEYERQQMERASKNQAIADKYNYSYDVTPAATVAYTPYSGDYAHYGEVGGNPQQVAVTPGATTRVQLASGGQADNIPANLSAGEYVFDADTVAALGDGNTKAGASALDQMRQEIRRHKRSAPIDKIPPKAKPAMAYLKKGTK